MTEDDPELLLAIANSLCQEDYDLERALAESVKTPQSRLDSFYRELCHSASNARKQRLINENHQYNAPLLVEDILLNILKYTSLSAMRAFHRTCRHVNKIMEEKLRCTSLYVESVREVSRIYPLTSYSGTLLNKIVPTINTLRFKIRKPYSSGSISGIFFSPSIKHIILNVCHIKDIEWFLLNFTIYKGKLTVYHELDITTHYSDNIVYDRLLYDNPRDIQNRKLVVNEYRKQPIPDMHGYLFNALTNF